MLNVVQETLVTANAKIDHPSTLVESKERNEKIVISRAIENVDYHNPKDTLTWQVPAHTHTYAAYKPAEVLLPDYAPRYISSGSSKRFLLQSGMPTTGETRALWRKKLKERLVGKVKSKTNKGIFSQLIQYKFSKGNWKKPLNKNGVNHIGMDSNKKPVATVKQLSQQALSRTGQTRRKPLFSYHTANSPSRK